jgi:N,N-dimethylglycine/sarcosine dehydrogenase ferredoxin subunit
MMSAWSISLLALSGLALLLAAMVVAAVARRWLVGRRQSVGWLRGLSQLPRRYLRDVHDVVARDRSAARFHMLTAGGLAVGLVCLPIMLLFPASARIVAILQLAAALAALAGVGLIARRRWFRAPSRLSRGNYQVLPVPLLLTNLFLGATAQAYLLGTAPTLLIWAILMVGGVGMGWLVLCVRRAPMKHVVAGTVNLVVHPRPGRFERRQRSANLLPLDLTAARLGVEAASDFPWNRLVNFDACVQCGRCEDACPAFASGQPLNPKKLIYELQLSMEVRGTDSAYAGSPHPGRSFQAGSIGPRAPLVTQGKAGEAGGYIDGDTLWSCTTCRACVQECPMFVEHVDAVIDLRRFQTLELGATPRQGAKALEALKGTDNAGGHPPDSRLDWAVDLALPVISAGKPCDVLVWLGEGAFDRRNQRTLRALVALLRRAGVDFAVLGPEERDCGDLARRLGDEALFQTLARQNIDTLSKYRFSRIVTADPHAFHCLKNEYPALGGRYAVSHHTSYLAELVQEGRLRPQEQAGLETTLARVTYHDPCYLARYNGETEAPRAILRALGVELAEMSKAGLRARCCGGGGGAPLSDIKGDRRIPDIRMDDVREIGATAVVVACPNCANMLEGVTGPRPVVMDIAELLASRTGASR